jgi:hypothetical protein
MLVFGPVSKLGFDGLAFNVVNVARLFFPHRIESKTWERKRTPRILLRYLRQVFADLWC